MSIAYDGTNYCGWQWQPNGLTIEEVLNRELTALLKEPIAVIGASRTDSGVHAKGNVAVFDTNARIPAEKICFALNQRLPEDIVIQESKEVPLDYHPRKRNTIKTYEYRILNRKLPFPLERLYAHFLYFPLDVEKMQKAADYLVGEHDFKSFCSAHTQAEETIRHIYSAQVYKEGDVVTVRLKGNGFLTHMVRIIAGTLMKVGTGQIPVEKVKEILEARDHHAPGATKAPAKGLTLIGIEEVENLEDQETVTNEHWDYTVYQDEIETKGNAYLVFRHSDDRDFIRNVERLVKHAYQNKAKQVYVMDAAGRLQEGEIGSYLATLCLQPNNSCYPTNGEWYLIKDKEILENQGKSAKILEEND